MRYCDCDYDELPSVFRAEEPIARVTHKCCECGHVILPGESYGKAVGCWDGRWETYKTCEPCADLRSSIEYLCPPITGLFESYGYVVSPEHAKKVRTSHRNRVIEETE